MTRRGLLRGAAWAGGLAWLGGWAFGASGLAGGRRKVVRLPSSRTKVHGQVRAFVTRPDLTPPAVTVTGRAEAPGYVFLGPGAGAAQAGPLLVDNAGEPVWFQPISRDTWLTNFRLSHYRGEPVLSWWEGKMTREGYGQGEGVIVDSSYREIARVRAGNGREMDAHEFLVTPKGTALFLCYPDEVPADLSSLGGPSGAIIQSSVLQEVDVKTGRVLFEWRSLDHIPTEESYQPPAKVYDYMHLNSIGVAPDGNLLLSARCTWALYKVDRRTGSVIWRLGGKNSDFQLESNAVFSWQHDARQPTDSKITLFDDGAAFFDDGSGETVNEPQSRGLVLDVDEKRRQARFAREYRQPRPLVADSMGSFQTLPNHGALVGWGSDAVASEFSPEGKFLFDVRLGQKHTSYRAYRYPWTAKPRDLPAVVPRRTSAESTLYVSWNGATEVSHWLVHAGSHPRALAPFGVAERQGFETIIPLGAFQGYARVTGLDASGRGLGTSEAVRL
jgi:Arylsulfotransferase (ASST)